MNGYKMTADSYREVLKHDREKMTEDAIKNMERSIQFLRSWRSLNQKINM